MERKFFLFVKSAEDALIVDYLEERLEPSVRKSFEERYLRVPELSRRVAEIQARLVRQQAERVASRRKRQARLAAVAALVLIGIGGAAVYLYRGALHVEPLPAFIRSHTVIAALTLNSGVLKGESAGESTLRVPPGRGDVRLTLALPGQQTSALYSAAIAQVLAGGGLRQIWSAPAPEWSTPRKQGQGLELVLDSSILARGDYVVEVRSIDGVVVGTYTLRVLEM